MKLREKFEGKVNYNGVDQFALTVKAIDAAGKKLLDKLKKGKTYRITIIEEDGD